MTETVYLSGSDDVRSGGRACSEAGDKMNHAASEITFAVERLERLLQISLDRMEAIITRHCEALDGFRGSP